MNTEQNLMTLKANAKIAEDTLKAATLLVRQAEALAENNVYDSLEEASSKIEDILGGRAYDDCEGSYNCGAEEYRQGFIAGGIKYVGILEVEYNRHDKTYYYVDSTDFRIEEVK